jgi:hypothetical protein
LIELLIESAALLGRDHKVEFRLRISGVTSEGFDR